MRPQRQHRHAEIAVEIGQIRCNTLETMQIRSDKDVTAVLADRSQ